MSERPHHAENPSQATEAERRAWVRHPCSRHALSQRFAQGSGEPWCPAQIRDISTGGFCLHTSRRFEPGTVLSVDLAADAGRRAPLPTARVRRASAGEGGVWLIGCQFLTPLSDDEFEALCRQSGAEPETAQPRLIATLAAYLPWPLSLAARRRDVS